MTREEAIKILEYPVKKWSMEWDEREDGLSYYEALDMAISALWQQDPNDWICTLKCTALMDEGMCSHGGLCCLYESQRTIKENQPFTLDELRKMDGEPVWLHTFSPVQKKTNVAQWAILETVGSANATFLRAGVNSRLTKWFCNYGERWLAYRQKPEEGTV